MQSLLHSVFSELVRCLLLLSVFFGFAALWNWSLVLFVCMSMYSMHTRVDVLDFSGALRKLWWSAAVRTCGFNASVGMKSMLIESRLLCALFAC